MALTPAQQATMKADITANGDLNSQPNTLDGAFEIARLYNLQASPNFWVWKQSLPLSDIYGLTSPAPANDTWDWTFYSGMNAGEQGAWIEMAGPERALNMERINIRSGIGVVYTGPQGGADARDHIYALGRELATRVQKLFATGTGSEAVPATRAVYTVNYQEVYDARNS